MGHCFVPHVNGSLGESLIRFCRPVMHACATTISASTTITHTYRKKLCYCD